MEIAAGIHSIIEDKSGKGMITPIVSVMLGTLFLILLSHFIYLYTMITGIADYTQKAVIQTAAANAYNAHSGVREGNSSAHYYAGSGLWQELVSTAEMSARLQETLQLTRSGDTLRKFDDDGNFRYAISDIQIRSTNVDVGAGSNDVRLTFHTTVTAEIRLYFLGTTLDVRKPISLTSYFTPRY